MALALALALAVLAGTIYGGACFMRARIQQHTLDHDGDVLYAVALAQQFNQASPPLENGLQTAADQLKLALNISQIREDVLAVRLFDVKGQFVAGVPTLVRDDGLPAADLAVLKTFRPVSHYRKQAHLADLFLAPEIAAERQAGSALPLLEVNLPIHSRGQRQLLGCAQILLNAQSLQRGFAALDRQLVIQSLLVFFGSGWVLSIALVWAFGRLRRANALLRQRTASLLRANHELTMAAKTQALGAVTAHLLHGLSNPLAVLRDSLAQQDAGLFPADGWKEALASASRMQVLVDETVRVLAEENGGDQYELTLAELAQILVAKVQPAARQAGVRLEVENTATGTLANREANLILLILENLLHNAIQATPLAKAVRLGFVPLGTEIQCEIRDEGPGIPDHLRDWLFTPHRSTKPGGHGIGLAISLELARHLEARLFLKETSPQGASFVLALPFAVFSDLQPAEVFAATQ